MFQKTLTRIEIRMNVQTMSHIGLIIHDNSGVAL